MAGKRSTYRRRLGDVTVRVRFAPSPTGMFHVGGARSALQNWIYAKQQGGVFVLRIEDTDAARNKPEWTEGILSALDWIGISRGSYEGPYFQSANAGEHRAAAARLYDVGPRLLLRLHPRGRAGPHRLAVPGLRRLPPRPWPRPRPGARAALPYARRGRDSGGRPDPW